jgi:hypothetical protein
MTKTRAKPIGRPRVFSDEERKERAKIASRKWALDNAATRKAESAASARKYYAKNKERICAELTAKRLLDVDAARAKERAAHCRNKDKANERSRQYHAAHKAQEADAYRLYMSNPQTQTRKTATRATWRAANRHKKLLSQQQRVEQHRKSKPDWFGELDDFVMQEASDLCKLRKTATSIDWQIDHIVPLVSKLVCGLHVAANIAVIPAKMNQSKGNRYWPDMP